MSAALPSCAVPQLAQHRIDERGARVHELLDGLFGKEAHLQILVRLLQQLTVRGGGAVRGGEDGRQARKQRPGCSAACYCGSVFDEVGIAR